MSLTQAEEVFNAGKVEAMEWFEKEVAGLRSGRVKPILIESITVEVYGTRNPIKSIASVSSSDARTLVVSPWDKNNLHGIEKAITEANIGVMPTVDGQVIRLSFPSLTEDDFYNGKQNLDDLIGKAQDELQERITAKEKDIQTI